MTIKKFANSIVIGLKERLCIPWLLGCEHFIRICSEKRDFHPRELVNNFRIDELRFSEISNILSFFADYRNAANTNTK